MIKFFNLTVYIVFIKKINGKFFKVFAHYLSIITLREVFQDKASTKIFSDFRRPRR